ncbi:MAG: hypothetical protein RR967_02385 [Anaerovoracaceae bacterium]
MIKKICNNKDGISIVIVTVIVSLIMIIGAAVLGFAANNMADSNSQIVDKSTYQVGKSVIGVFTRQLTSNKADSLGRYILTEAKNKVAGGETSYQGNIDKEFQFTLPGDIGRNYHITAITASYDLSVIKTSDEKSTNTGITINNMICKFNIKHKTDSDGNITRGAQKMSVKYTYSGNYMEETNQSPLWTGQWKVLGVNND